jgi:hypothetical protein
MARQLKVGQERADIRMPFQATIGEQHFSLDTPPLQIVHLVDAECLYGKFTEFADLEHKTRIHNYAE